MLGTQRSRWKLGGAPLKRRGARQDKGMEIQVFVVGPHCGPRPRPPHASSGMSCFPLPAPFLRDIVPRIMP